MLDVIDAKTARGLGLARYFTGSPCKHGHLAERYTKRLDCVKCRALIVEKWRRRNKGLYVSGTDRWRKQNPAHHRGLSAHCTALQRAGCAAPAWALREELRRIYADCPKGLEVDHIIPLAAGDVCGLHVPANLQYLLRSDNRKKGRKYVR